MSRFNCFIRVCTAGVSRPPLTSVPGAVTAGAVSAAGWRAAGGSTTTVGGDAGGMTTTSVVAGRSLLTPSEATWGAAGSLASRGDSAGGRLASAGDSARADGAGAVEPATVDRFFGDDLACCLTRA